VLKPKKQQLDGRHLYVESLAHKIEAIESGRVPMQAMTYRVHARMLRRALLSHPEASFSGHDAAVWGVMEEALANVCFESHGYLPTVSGKQIKQAADLLIARCAAKRSQSGV
jgi:hypothetical protein